MNAMCDSTKSQYLLHGKFFGFNPPPSGIVSGVALDFPLQILAFEIPLLLGIANDLSWGGYRYFLQPYNVGMISL